MSKHTGNVNKIPLETSSSTKMGEKLKVICEELHDHPKCIHGPTLLFCRTTASGRKDLFYACSACRRKEDCSFYMKKVDKIKDNQRAAQSPFVNLTEINRLRDEILRCKGRSYCHQCRIIYDSIHENVHENHEVITNLTSDQIKSPTKFLLPLNNDKKEAQYFFSEPCLEYFARCFKQLKINKVVCIGTPTVYEYLQDHSDALKINSILLDLDYRFGYFYPRTKFCCYNMFNNYFFEEDGKRVFETFLQDKMDESILLIVDPPFGCRTEPLVQSLKEISSQYRKLNKSNRILPIFWIFPYYMQTYIENNMPELEMADYKVDYTNHMSYTNEAGGRKYGSPVRIFTNVPLNALPLPDEQNYGICTKCKRWKAAENKHCDLCKECPSKNGQTYRHCRLCGKCVKPNYQHCSACSRCVLKTDHSCEDYQKHLNCWICHQKGHNEPNCEKWKVSKFRKNKNLANLVKQMLRKEQRICLICENVGHNELRCPQREKLLKENCFLGYVENIFNRTTEWNVGFS